MAALEEIIFTKHCGIDIGNLKDGELIDPNKIKVSPKVYDDIIDEIKTEYPKLSELEINLILLQYGANIDESLKEDEIRLLDGYLRRG